MENERKQKLLPYFAFLYSKEVAPDRYGNIESIEEWSKMIESDLETLEKINTAVDQLTDEDWKSLENRYNEETSSGSAKNTVTQFAKNGAKLNSLKKLKNYKKGGKKCKCGCEIVITKEEGGKLVSKCACGCDDVKKTSKKEKGGVLEGLEDKFDEFKKYTQKWERRTKSNKLKKFKE